jgi:hypothetical protein
MNIKMDSLTKSFWAALDAAPLANEGWTVLLHHEKVSRIHKETMYSQLFKPKAKAYWLHRRHQMSSSAFDW